MTYALPEHPSFNNQPRYTPTKLSRTPSARTATGSVSPYTGSGQTYVNRRATSARLTPAVSTKEDLNEVKRNEQIKARNCYLLEKNSEALSENEKIIRRSVEKVDSWLRELPSTFPPIQDIMRPYNIIENRV